MGPSDLPAPETLLRRHRALMAVEDLFVARDHRFRHFGAGPGTLHWYRSGSGDDYRLTPADGDLLLTVFAHESPWSPWARDGDGAEWPGMFDGMPGHLRDLLPWRAGEPLSVSACFWFTGGAWHEGDPEPVPADGLYADDPGGAAELLFPLMDPEEAVREFVEEVFEAPERLEEARTVLLAAGG